MLTNQSITLRPWQQKDRNSLLNYANNQKIFNNLTDRFPHPFTQESADWFLNWTQSHNPPQILAIDLNGEAIGSIGLHPQEDVFRFNCELGYWLAEPYWGKGYTTQAVLLMLDYARKNFPFRRIFARPYGHNEASQKVLEKAGFKLEAKFEKTVFKNGRFEDEWVYGYRF